jgi:transposase
VFSSLSAEGMGPSLTLEGATNAMIFETYVEMVLARNLQSGQVMVMDNLSAHKGERLHELIEGKGCQLLYLPAHSPDFNPIEQAFSKIKDLLRKAEARNQQALVDAIGQVISAVSAEDARGFFEHCGYGIAVPSLW